MKTLRLRQNETGPTRARILLGFEAPAKTPDLGFISRALAAAEAGRVQNARTCRRIAFHMGKLSEFSTEIGKRTGLLLEKYMG